MLDDGHGFKKIYIATGLCSAFYYPHLLENILLYFNSVPKDEDKIITLYHKAEPVQTRH